MAPFGLISRSEGSSIPLKSIQIRAKVHGYTAEVVATMKYENNSNTPIEVIYVFPLDEESAICGFQATINGRTIVGEVEEKQEARDTYDDAISSGHTAYLLEESDESSDIFQIGLGNLPPHKEATIEITLVTGLTVEKDGKIIFILPTVLNPRYNPVNSQRSVNTIIPTIASVSTVYVFDFELDVQCASAIQEIISPGNRIKVDINPEDDRQAKVRLNEQFKFNFDLQVHILSCQPFKPHALVENGITKTKDGKDSNNFLSKPVVMLNFFPEFHSSSSLERGEFLFVIDRSGSMKGTKIRDAREALLLFLKSLPTYCYFNVIGFGSVFQKLFQKSEVYNDSTVDVACSHAQTMQADLGGTEILSPLQELFSQPLIKGYPRQVFLLTDGEVANTQQVIELVARNASKSRCFTFGVGEGASSALVKGVARAGKGRAEFVYSGDRLQQKVMRSLRNALQPAVKDVQVTWSLPKNWDVENVPTTCPTIFAGNRFVCFGIFSRKDQTEHNMRQIVAIEGTATLTGHVDEGSNSGVIQHVIKFSAVSGNPGDTSMMLHRLCAKIATHDKHNYLQGKMNNSASDDLKFSIIEMSKCVNIVSKLTSFVAFDQENHEPVSRAMERPIQAKINQDGGGRVFALYSKVGKRMLEGPPHHPIPGAAAPPPPPRVSSKIAGTKAIEHFTSKHSAASLTTVVPGSNSLIADKSRVNNHIDLISLQKACGSWLPTAQLASIAGITINELKEACPKELADESKQSVWATALALSCLFGKFEDNKYEWEIVAAKGIKWLKAKLSVNNLSYVWIMNIASEFVKI